MRLASLLESFLLFGCMGWGVGCGVLATRSIYGEKIVESALHYTTLHYTYPYLNRYCPYSMFSMLALPTCRKCAVDCIDLCAAPSGGSFEEFPMEDTSKYFH